MSRGHVIAVANLKGGNDMMGVALSVSRVRSSHLPLTINGEAGNDLLRGGSGVDRLDGGGGLKFSMMPRSPLVPSMAYFGRKAWPSACRAKSTMAPL